MNKNSISDICNSLQSMLVNDNDTIIITKRDIYIGKENVGVKLIPTQKGFVFEYNNRIVNIGFPFIGEVYGIKSVIDKIDEVYKDDCGNTQTETVTISPLNYNSAPLMLRLNDSLGSGPYPITVIIDGRLIIEKDKK